jgi:hypothetical protein
VSLAVEVSRVGENEVVPVLSAVVGRLAEMSLAGLDDEELRRQLAVCETVVRRVQARQARLVAERVERETRRLRDAGIDSGRAGGRAARRAQRDLSHELGWSPSQAKAAHRTGKQAQAAPEAGRALDEGRLSEGHARSLFELLSQLEGDERREVEAELTAVAQEQTAVEFSRTCRRRLAQLDHAAAVRTEERRRERRRGRMAETEDGMLALSVQVAGVDKALVGRAVEAFRRPDVAGERRSAEQATADAVVELCRAALRAGEAPAVHGVRPHVQVHIPWETLLARAGVVEVAGAGPLPFGEVRRLLADCGVSRLLTDPTGVPVEVGGQVRTVPAGLWRALLARDAGCVADGCDAPAAWCEVMHLGTPYRFGGRLTMKTAALGCAEHHDRYDRGGWKVTWIAGRPVLHHPRRPPRGHPASDSRPSAGDGKDPASRHDTTQGRPRPAAAGTRERRTSQLTLGTGEPSTAPTGRSP